MGSRRYNRRYNERYNGLKFPFHLPEAITKVLGVRTYRKYLNLAAALPANVFTLEYRVTDACISLIIRINPLRDNILSFYDDFAV